MSGWKAIIDLCFVIDLLVLRFKAGLSAKPSHNLSVSLREAVFLKFGLSVSTCLSLLCNQFRNSWFSLTSCL